MKAEREFFDTQDAPWVETPGSPGVLERVLSRQDDVIFTRLAHWAPGLDTSAAGVIRHDYVEEVYLLSGQLTDLTLGETFGVGHYASRPPGMPHGPYRTDTGATMLEVRYR
jgi:ChrR Cupin-like domain